MVLRLELCVKHLLGALGGGLPSEARRFPKDLAEERILFGILT
jgi:hypothetical protein